VREIRQHTVSVDDGAQIHVFESGQPGGQQVLLAHAAGFHARCWDKVIEQLPATWQVFALDLRGHGRSSKQPPYEWSRFAQDVLCVARHFNLQRVIGVGHSLGGHCIAHVSALAPDLFTRLVLIDPVIFAPEKYHEPSAWSPDQVADHPVARRRGQFASWQAMYERFVDRAPYSLWRPEILQDYCQFGVLPSADGSTVELACPPAVEAAVYITNFDTDIYPLLGDIAQPVMLLRAKPRDENAVEMDFSSSPTWPELAGIFQQATDVSLPELTHFIPMQAPELVAGYIAQEGA